MEEKPQVKSGWGTGGNNVQTNSQIGMNKKTNAAAYWDNKTTELIIPEVEEMQQELQQEEVVVSAPASVATEMIGL